MLRLTPSVGRRGDDRPADAITAGIGAMVFTTGKTHGQKWQKSAHWILHWIPHGKNWQTERPKPQFFARHRKSGNVHFVSTGVDNMHFAEEN